YQFEAGRTYTAEYTYKINPAYGETHKFTEDTSVALSNPDPSKCTITGEVTEVRDSGRIVDVLYTMTIAGERSYPDIESVTLQKVTTPAAGIQAETTALMYSNCTLTSQAWSPSVSTFVSGNSYTLTVNLHANDGYKFTDDFAPVLGIEGYEKSADNVELLNGNKDAAVSFTYNVGSYIYIDTLQFDTDKEYSTFVPTRETSGQPMNFPFYPADGTQFENRNTALGYTDTTYWYNETDGYEMDYTKTFEAGKVYSLSTVFDIKKDMLGEYRFADNATAVIDGEGFSPGGYRVECVSSGTSIIVKFSFTAQLPEEAGDTADNPVTCYSYEDFKYAMENYDIRYVALGNVEDTVTKIEGDGLIPAISVNGIKYLNVIENATFTAPAGGDGYKTVCALLHCEQGSTLNLSGAGKLTFKAVTNASYNAVVWNQGGSVYVDGATLIGSYNTAVYGKAIWQSYGELRISDGQFFAENALAPGLLPGAHTAVYIDGGQAWIQDGTFKAESHIDTIDLHYGLDIGQYATVDLSGGTYHGILLPTSSTPLANYMDEELYTPLSDESKFNPASEYSQGYVESGKVVRIAWMIDHVDVHINAPIAGVDITENYFNIPTSGCKVTMYYPQWYKNGESITYGTFEAGASYKVVVWVDAKADYGAEFTNGVTVAINNQSVAVDRKSEHLIAVEYDFGVCPNVVPEVELTVTAPKEGNTPSYTVGCGSDAYYAVGGSNNYTEYRKWYESSDGDDWWEINTSSEFKSGYYYKFVTDIRTINGYEFPLIDNGTIQPNVSATVNGYYANVIKAYDQDPSRYITVEYNFGECNDDVVENIAITSIDAPVAGQTPDYTANCFGTGYSMAGTNSGNWKVNGIVWLRDGNIYTGSIMDNTEKFQAGHEYTVMIDLVADNGYTFLFNHGNSIYATTSINGNTAQIAIDNCSTTGYQVWYTFTCGKQEIPAIMLYNLDEPVGGEVPDTSVTAAYPEYYTVQSVTWTDIEGGAVGATFETGVPYQATIVVTATAQAGFTADPTVYIDGNQPNSNKITVNNEKDTVTVVYTFSKPASAPELPSNIPVSGSAVSRNGSDDAVYLLYKSSTADATILQEWAAGAYNALYTAVKGGITDATVNGKAMKEQSFTFEGVQMGVYKLAILKPGGYAPKIVGVTATGASVELGRQILQLRADVDADGEHSAKDVTLLRRGLAGGYGVSLDIYAADANGDGEGNAKDVTLLRRVLAGGFGVTIG
ncbi:MAG: dockerin type I repeat-containing protein, partial [Oscillospiraceae bacterium]|nr:dockerin type I repeat-containing protein [Oscillospiraceae bacterium]